MNNINRLIYFIGFALTLSISFTIPVSAAPAHVTPESGWWWNTSASGRGYAIEIQDNVAFIATFTYDPLETDGVRRPIWFAAAGALTGDRIFSGVFDLYEDGQCVGCTYSAPSIHPSEKHTLQIEFTTSTSAIMTIDGESFAIERFIFAPRYSNPHEKLLGEWSLVMTSPTSFTSNASIPVSGEMLVFEDIEILEDVINIWGCRKTNTTQALCTESDIENRRAVARYFPDFGSYYILAYDGLSHLRAYDVNLYTEKVEGLVDRFAASGGTFDDERARHVRGFRSASAQFVQTGAGPAKSDQRISKSGLWDSLGLTESQNTTPLSREEIFESLAEALKNR